MFPETLAVEVTQEDIDIGIPRRSMCCPVARAINRVAEGGKACVGGNTAILGDAPYEEIYRLPEEAYRFISRFDNYETVSPISFVAVKRERN